MNISSIFLKSLLNYDLGAATYGNSGWMTNGYNSIFIQLVKLFFKTFKT